MSITRLDNSTITWNLPSSPSIRKQRSLEKPNVYTKQNFEPSTLYRSNPLFICRGNSRRNRMYKLSQSELNILSQRYNVIVQFSNRVLRRNGRGHRYTIELGGKSYGIVIWANRRSGKYTLSRRGQIRAIIKYINELKSKRVRSAIPDGNDPARIVCKDLKTHPKFRSVFQSIDCNVVENGSEKYIEYRLRVQNRILRNKNIPSNLKSISGSVPVGENDNVDTLRSRLLSNIEQNTEKWTKAVKQYLQGEEI